MDQSWGTAAVSSTTPARLNTSCCLKKLNALGGRRKPALAAMPPHEVCDLTNDLENLPGCILGPLVQNKNGARFTATAHSARLVWPAPDLRHVNTAPS